MLEIGDPALVCAVSAAHRGQAFAVCSELVDRIKEQVPIWKEQFFADGSVEWVGAGGSTPPPIPPAPTNRHPTTPQPTPAPWTVGPPPPFRACEVTHVRGFRPASGPTVGLRG